MTGPHATALEQRLAALADDAFPPTPNLTAAWAVSGPHQVPETAHGWRWREWGRRHWLPAALAALLVPAAAIGIKAASTPGVKIVTVQKLPPLPPGPEPEELGDSVPSVAEAAKKAGFAVQTLPEEPAMIRVAGDLVTLGYGDVVITEARSRPEPDVLVKKVTVGTQVEKVPPNGYFISGAPHEVAYLSPDGRFVLVPPRLAGNTYVFIRRGLMIRIEAKDLTLARGRQLSKQLAAPETP